MQHLLSKYDEEAGGTDGPVQVPLRLPLLLPLPSAPFLFTWALTTPFGLLPLSCIFSLGCHCPFVSKTLMVVVQ